MSRITVTNLVKAYGGEDLFDGLSFEIAPGMRLAVAGPNGCGKSTLLRILAGEVEPDGGQVAMEKGARLGYVAQELGDEDLEQALLPWVLAALPSWGSFWREWEQAVASGDEARIRALSERQHELEAGMGYNPEHRARAILTGLGFSEDKHLRRIGELSGGWRERAKLARVLLQGADVLLLDEPTNHLDLEAVEWLENYLLNFRGAVAFVAHDRVFLDRVGSHVLFLGGARPMLRKGSFAEFLEWEAEAAQQREREAAKLSARIEHEQSYIRRFRVKARKAAQAQSKLKKVEKLQAELSKVQDDTRGSRPGRSLAFALPEPRRGDKVAVSAVDLEFAYQGDHKVWHKLDFQVFRGRKIALAAPNGAGKSTLLKLIAGSLKPTHGHVKIGPNTDMAYFSQHQTEILRPTGSVLSEIRRLSDPRNTEEQLMGVLGLFLLGEPYFERPVAALSGGEKSRLLLATLFLARPNFLLLDEPTNHLDLESREGLVQALRDYEGTLLFVAHDRYLMSEVADEIWSLSQDGIVVFSGGFAEYDAHRRAEQAAEKAAETSPAKSRADKEDKRRAAEIRNRISREMKPLKDEYAKLEGELDKALTEQAELEAGLNDPATYADSGKALELNARYRETSEWAEGLIERMGRLELEMERLNGLKQEMLAE
ncbi:MAG: ribosomal protection-like ABC-F family protein [Desulfovibrio aminophilus]|jgi:ATPase components of ABC transporters with duplicated ATPase domains|nr:ABC-F family ATP-binding cassette domain-containing protein [Desulfovibrionaceae bacterium]